MVWPFKRKKETIDLTYLAKRGLIKNSDVSPSASPISADSGLGFLGDMASSAEPSEDTGTKNKIEDIEFKLDNLMKKIDNIIDRLDVVERKTGSYRGSSS
ncbi:hypothetical protein FJZ19_05315 [Candidatus Pacearchaeota archaeon]|nr:hypothetical protein [Candidatus Pacearchaeota archaeon]